MDVISFEQNERQSEAPGTYVGADTGDGRVAGRLADTLAGLINATNPELLEGSVGLDARGGEECSSERGKEHGETEKRQETADAFRPLPAASILSCRSVATQHRVSLRQCADTITRRAKSPTEVTNFETMRH